MVEEENKDPIDKNWISLGDRQFYIEDVQSIYIQANHLIVSFEGTEKQIVIFFGHSPKGYQNAKKVFEALGEMYNACKIDLPSDAIVTPDLMKTVYKDKVDKAIQDGIRYEKEKFKNRYHKKLQKALDTVEELTRKLEEKS
jgi:hypothetical protein